MFEELYVNGRSKTLDEFIHPADYVLLVVIRTESNTDYEDGVYDAQDLASMRADLRIESCDSTQIIQRLTYRSMSGQLKSRYVAA
jgi:hypothetical protein